MKHEIFQHVRNNRNTSHAKKKCSAGVQLLCIFFLKKRTKGLYLMNEKKYIYIHILSTT